jgi:hypothetical protein
VSDLPLALTRTARVTGLRRLGSLASRTGGALILIVGAYVAHYGWYEIRVQNNPATQDPVIDAAGSVQRGIADTLDTIGPGVIAALLAALLIGGVVLRRRRPGTPSQAPSGPGNAPAP